MGILRSCRAGGPATQLDWLKRRYAGLLTGAVDGCYRAAAGGMRDGHQLEKRNVIAVFALWLRRCVVSGACVGLGFLPPPAAAQAQEQINWCLNKGNAYSPDLVIKGCTAVIESGKAPAGIYVNRGNAYTVKKDYDLAIADYTQALQLDPKYAAAYNNRAYSYNAKKNYAAAIADFNEAI